MNRTDSPSKQATPFGVNGQREPLLPTTPAGDNTASYELGFPPVTMIIKSAGGLPPKGQDMNQILYELSSLSRWSSTGAINTFDNQFSSSIGGYPKGAMLISNDMNKIYVSTIDGNTNDPNSINTGWQDLFLYLGLKTAAQREVGTGTNQIPDMSSFLSMKASPGYLKLPSGIIIQWGSASTGADGSIFATYPIAFPNQVLTSSCTNLGEFPTGPVAATTPSLVSIRLSCIANSSGTGAPGVSIAYLVVGY